MDNVVVTSKGHRFDRVQPPPMPAHRMLTRAFTGGVLFADYTRFDSKIKDQGQEGFCTGNAGAKGGESIFRMYFNKQPIFSAQYVYARELIQQGDFPQDDGSDGLTLCGVVTSFGFCEEALYPSIPGQILMPTPAQDANARQWAMGAYHGVSGSETAVSIVMDKVPWPICIGFDVPQSFEGDEVAATGIMIPMQPGETPIGGHEICCCVGGDVSPTPVLRPKNCPPALLFDNSWGADWGLSGRLWVPLEVLDNPTTDIKIFHTGHPW